MFADGHALLIGVGTYKYSPRHNVSVTERDAKAVAKILKDEAFCGYPEEQITLLNNTDATKSDIENALTQLAQRTTDKSTVFLFFCSHGGYGSDDNWYFMPHDVKLKKINRINKIVPETGLGQAQLVELIRKIPASKLFIVFNTCHSGNMSQSLDITAEDEPLDSVSPGKNVRAALLMEGKGTVIITAAGEDQLSHFHRSENLTIFTQALYDGLRGEIEVANRNGYISAFNLYESLYFVVEKEAQEIDKVQQPEINVLQGVGSLPIALYKGNPKSLSVNGFKGENALSADTNAHAITAEEATRAAQNILGDHAIQISESQNVTIDQSQVKVGGDNNSGVQIGSIGGSYVGGNQTTYGPVTGSGNAIGAGASVTTHNVHQAGAAGAQDLTSLFTLLRQTVNQQVNEATKEMAMGLVQQLETEVAKGSGANDGQMAMMVAQLGGMASAAAPLISKIIDELANSGVNTTTTQLMLNTLMKS